MVAGTLQLDTMQVYVLIDPGASHSFVSYRIVNNLHVLSSNLGVGVTVSTPLGENIHIFFGSKCKCIKRSKNIHCWRASKIRYKDDQKGNRLPYRPKQQTSEK